MNETESSLNPALIPDKASLVPTRKLKAAERRVFDRVASEFIHLVPSDAEQLTQYAETVVRYETALKDTKKAPTVSVPVVNRSTGNVTGERTVRNPAFATVKESSAMMTSLARRLMIDAHSAEKRQRLLTKKARALAAAEAKSVESAAVVNGVTEEQIEAEMKSLAKTYIHADDDSLRQNALWYLTVFLPSENFDADEYGMMA